MVPALKHAGVELQTLQQIQTLIGPFLQQREIDRTVGGAAHERSRCGIVLKLDGDSRIDLLNGLSRRTRPVCGAGVQGYEGRDRTGR